MSLAPEILRSSHAACRRLTRRARSNLPLSFLVLSRPKRRAMNALYAFMRHTDDLVDNPQPVAARREALARWRSAVEEALAGRFAAPASEDPQHGALEHPVDAAGRALLPALIDAVNGYHVPHACLEAVIDGVEIDLDGPSFETFDELVAYCEKVASAVGCACIHVWGFCDEAALELARKCGVAFQLTNILRDLKEDAESGRVYLPREDIRRCGYSSEGLRRGVENEALARLLALEIGRAERLYREGAELFNYLRRDGRRVFGMMTSIYYALLIAVRQRGPAVLRGRVRLTRWTKLRIAARWLLLPPRRSVLP